jgi:LysM repeat protein
MRPSTRMFGLLLLALALASVASACQLLDLVAPAGGSQPANGSTGGDQSPANQSPGDQSPGDLSPRISDPEDLPPTWTPLAPSQSETAVAPEVVITAQAAGNQVTYTVQSGDTLAEIATRFNVTLEALATANNIEDYDHIEAGQVLVIPG